MILLELKDFFRDRQKASVMDVAKHYQIELSAAQGMIDFWVKRGGLRLCERACAKTSCGGCSLAANFYMAAQ